MFRIMITTLLFLLHILFLPAAVYDNDSFVINGVRFDIIPEVNYRTTTSMLETLTFTSTLENYADSCRIIFANPALDMSVSFNHTSAYLSQAWIVSISIRYKQAILMRDIALKLDFENYSTPLYLNGIKAINSHLSADNVNLYPYTDKMVEVMLPESAIWIAGSNYPDCQGVEWINNNTVYFYDHSLHFARRYNQSNPLQQYIDYMPKSAAQNDNWSFLIFEQKPCLLSINRWQGDKKAAFALTNDADGETVSKLKAVYFGSSNPESPAYLTKGLIANHVKVSNTVFGMNYPSQSPVWNPLMEAGNTIGYHTYSSTADSTQTISHSLLSDLTEYNVRLWIDHALPYNPEDFGMDGGSENSPYYVQDVVNQSGIDYIWLGDTPSNNAFNAFDDPWRLPHRVHYFQNLTRPIWFFGRTRMETWEYLNDYYIYDLKHNLTAENLDSLIHDNGLCVGYTHFGFGFNATVMGFYDLLEGNVYQIRDDFNDVLVMLHDYQANHGLWIDTVESIFDRMLAIEQVQVVKVENDACPGFVRITLENDSDKDLTDLTYWYGDQKYNIPLFMAHSQQVLLNSSDSTGQTPALQPYQMYYNSNNIYVRSKNSDFIPPLKVDIYNIKGQLVTTRHTKNQSNYLVIPFAQKSSGIYIARLTAVGFKTQTQRISVIK